MISRWVEAPASSPAEQLVHQSRLVGAEESLVLWGGGNNSLKTSGQDLLGNRIEVMLIKSSGSDMKSIVPRQFPEVRLDYIRALRHRSDMSDEEMVEFLTRCLVDPGAPRPSIETLLHAFLPAAAVLHTHADAILALCNTRGGEETVRRCFGDAVPRVPYRRPGFLLSRDVAERFESQPDAAGFVLMNHGLITWGDTPAQAYERHIELVSAAEAYVPRTSVMVPEVAHRQRIQSLAAVLRGTLSEHRPVILELDTSDGVVEFVNRPDLERVTAGGAATPDHLLYTKRFPLIVPPEAGAIREGMRAYVERYTATYAARHSTFPMLEPLPRVVLMPGVGMFTAGKDARAARIVRDIYRHTIQIISAAEKLGGYRSLNDADAFNAEYWPLELYKLSLLPAERELAGRVALITGAANGIGRAVALRLAREGAHVIVADLDLPAAQAVAESVISEQGLRRALAVRMDVSDEASVEGALDAACCAYGGLDVVVSNAGISSFGLLESLPLEDWERSFAVNTRGHFLVARGSMRVMREQGRGGSIVFNASKNVTAPGREFGAYSVSKAAEAQLCRIVALEGGEHGVRANMLNPDAIFDGSRFWSDEMRSMRARAYGIDVENLPEFYRNRTLLHTTVTSEDVAEAALFLASGRSGKTTGAMLPVDGGVKEAFPR